MDRLENALRLDRRTLLGATAAGAGAMLAAVATPSAAAPRGGRPPDGEFVVRGGHVLTMDPALGDLPDADVHVRDGEIMAVGRELRSAGEQIDARGMIVLPGLIDTHWHMWTALYRSLASSSQENAYFALNLRLGPHVQPLDLYRGIRVALADAVCSGITTVHDWAHNIRGPEHADAALSAHAEFGLRGRFSYGTPQGHPAAQPIDLADLSRVHADWFTAGRVPRMHLGLAGRPPGASPEAVYRAEYDAARGMDLPVSYHVSSTREQGQLEMIRLLGEEGMLGPHTQLIHAMYASAAERSLVASSGASVSVSPWSEMLIGYGVPPVGAMLAEGVPVSLSVDTLPLTGTAELFSVLRLTMGLVRGQTENEFGVSAHRMLELATIEGARGLGLADVTGSLTPGKRADLIMVRGDDLNIAPFTDPANMITLAAQPSNVDTVISDGRVVKYAGRLTVADLDRIVREAEISLEAVQARAD